MTLFIYFLKKKCQFYKILFFFTTISNPIFWQCQLEITINFETYYVKQIKKNILDFIDKYLSCTAVEKSTWLLSYFPRGF